MSIYLSSDYHFGHDREFIYKPRGFNSIEEMNETIIKNHNSVVDKNDDFFFLGDLMLGDNEIGIDCVSRLNGRIHLIRGNHDTDKRWNEIYPKIPNIVQFHGWSDVIQYRKYHFYLSHFPTETANITAESLKQCTLNLFGHTHSNEIFRNDIPMYYNVAPEAHNNTPVLLDDIIDEMKIKAEECLRYL